MLKISHLSKSFDEILAVDDLSLNIGRGEIFGLLGPNGAGKTTTVNMCVGLLEPDSGSVEVDGRGSPMDPRVRSSIGVAPQIVSLYDEMTGEENVTFFARLCGMSSADRRKRTDDVLAFVGLSDRRRDRVKTYSGGMQRRLNLAVALVHDPPLLLLDEPTVGVDPQSRNRIFESIEALRDEGRTVVYTTHYMEEAQRLCDRVAIVDQGRLLALDTVDGLIAKFGGRSVVKAERATGSVRVETDDPMAELARLRAEGELLRFSVDQPDLEAVFLELTGRRLRD